MSRGLPERLDGRRVAVRAFTLRDVAERTLLVRANREYTTPWDPIRPAGWYGREGQERELRLDIDAWARGTGYPFAVLDRSDGDRMVGRVALSNVVRGAWLNATIGWWIAQDVTNRGYGEEAVRLVLRFAFEHAGLHRVQPAIIPRNAPSQRLAEKLGFRHEGRAVRYLNINGVWEDHDIYAMTSEEWFART